MRLSYHQTTNVFLHTMISENICCSTAAWNSVLEVVNSL